MKFFRKIAGDENGETAIEYSLLALFAVLALTIGADALSTSFITSGQQLEMAMTGQDNAAGVKLQNASCRQIMGEAVTGCEELG